MAGPWDFGINLLNQAVQDITSGTKQRFRLQAEQKARDEALALQQAQREEDLALRAREREEDFAFRAGVNAQNVARQQQQEISDMVEIIGDDDPALVAALEDISSDLQEGLAVDPRYAQDVLGRARATIQRTQFRPSVEPQFEGSAYMGAPTTLRPEVTEEEIDTAEAISRARARAGSVTRAREMDAEQREMEIDRALRQFTSDLQAQNQATQNAWTTNREAIKSAREALNVIVPMWEFMTPEERAAYGGVLDGLRTIASSDPGTAGDLIASIRDQDFVEGVAALGGITAGLTARQDRLADRWENLVRNIQDNPDYSPGNVNVWLDDAIALLPEHIASPEEVALVRSFVNNRSTFSSDEYKQAPWIAGAEIAKSYTNPDGTVDLQAMRDNNPTLYDLYSGNQAWADEAVETYYMRQALQESEIDQIEDAEVERVIFGFGDYGDLSDEQRGAVKRALGLDASATDADVQAKLDETKTMSVRLREADTRLRELQATTAEMNLAEEAGVAVSTGNIPATQMAITLGLIAPEDADEALATASQIFEWEQVRLEADSEYRRNQADLAWESLQEARALGPLKVAALRAQYQFDRENFRSQLANLTLANDLETIASLSELAEVLPPEAWTEGGMPPSVGRAIELLRMPNGEPLINGLVAISKAKQYDLGTPMRNTAFDMARTIAQSVPEDREMQIALLRNAFDEAEIAPGVTDMYANFLNGAWDLIEADEARADSRLALGWANHNLAALRNAEGGGDAEGLEAILSAVNTQADNRRLQLDANWDDLVAMGCAVGDTMFDNNRAYRADRTVRARAGEALVGQSCGTFVQEFQDDLASFNKLLDVQDGFLIGLGEAYELDVSDLRDTLSIAGGEDPQIVEDDEVPGDEGTTSPGTSNADVLREGLGGDTTDESAPEEPAPEEPAPESAAPTGDPLAGIANVDLHIEAVRQNLNGGATQGQLLDRLTSEHYGFSDAEAREIIRRATAGQ